MTHFEYVTMVISFVLAFAVSQLLSGWAHQYSYRDRHSPYVLHTVASLLFLITLVQSIWGNWALRDVPWTFGPFLLYFTSTLPLAGAATLIPPPLTRDGMADARSHYFAMRGAAFSLLAAWIAMSGLLEWILLDHVAAIRAHFGASVGVRAVALAVLGWLAVSDRPSHHWIGLSLLLGVLAAFVFQIAGGVDPRGV